MKYVASLISGVGIFCLGTGLSLYHGISGLVNPVPIGDFHLVCPHSIFLTLKNRPDLHRLGLK